MSVRFVISFLFLLPLFLGTEIIHFSKLKKQKSQYSIKRDIFSPDSIILDNPFSKSITNPSEEADKAKNEKKQIKKMEQQIFFEGFIVRKNKSFALLSINGEYFVVGEGDTVAENITVKKINKKMILLEINSNSIEIFLKGVNNE